jgi:hypothetical protein
MSVSKPVLRIHDILGWIRICGSMPLTNGSGSCYFHHWPSRCQQKLIFNTIFSAYYFLKVHLHHFLKIKSRKESQDSRNQGFSYYFCMIIEGSGFGSKPLTSGSESGSWRPKNIWIQWIRIRNTAQNSPKSLFCQLFFLVSANVTNYLSPQTCGFPIFKTYLRTAYLWPPITTTLAVNCKYLLQFFYKIEMASIGYWVARGKLIHEKTWNQKSWFKLPLK